MNFEQEINNRNIVKKFQLKNFTKGWFIGDFEPSLFQTKNFEAGVKFYKKGDREDSHYHKLADEFTVIVSGSCKFNSEILQAGEIAWAEKNEVIAFEALEDCVTVVVKIPSVRGDKYFA